MRWIWLFCACLCLCLTGCELKDSLPADLNLNWQTAALVILAYLANSRGHMAGVAEAVRSILRGLKLLPPAESVDSLSAEDVARLLADLYVRLKGHPELQAGILQLMQPTDAANLPAPADDRPPKRK